MWGPPHVGPHASLFLAPLHLLTSPTIAPYIFCLSCLSKASTCFPTYVSISLHYQPIRAASWLVSRRCKPMHATFKVAPWHSIAFPAAPQCQWPAMHLPCQHPCSSSGASHFEGDAKSYRVAHKMVWSRRGKRFFFLSLFIWMLSIFNKVIEIVCNQKSIQAEKM